MSRDRLNQSPKRGPRNPEHKRPPRLRKQVNIGQNEQGGVRTWQHFSFQYEIKQITCAKLHTSCIVTNPSPHMLIRDKVV